MKLVRVEPLAVGANYGLAWITRPFRVGGAPAMFIERILANHGSDAPALP
jgi:hypothetical protein